VAIGEIAGTAKRRYHPLLSSIGFKWSQILSREKFSWMDWIFAADRSSFSEGETARREC